MAQQTATKPVEDTVAKIDDEIAVGSDPVFQRRWIRMERFVWILFGVFIILDLIGLFGRGPLSKAHAVTKDGSMDVTYERIERFSTSSILTVKFGPSAIHDGKVQLWVSDSLVKPLGNQRVVPQPAVSSIHDDGVLYTFPVSGSSGSVEFALEPSAVGVQPLALRIPGSEQLALKVFVVP
jgi:hypothetical protein